MKQLVGLVAGFLLFTGSVYAQNKSNLYQSCSVSGTTSWCYTNNLPHLNQNTSVLSPYWEDPSQPRSSKLCAPTSAIMGAMANYYSTTSRIIPSMSFILMTLPLIQYQMPIMMSHMGTTAAGGTPYSGIKKYIDLRSSYRSWRSYYVEGSNAKNFSFPFSQKYSLVPIITYGHWYRSDQKISGRIIRSFQRRGGHVVANYGTKNVSWDWVYIYDPWYMGKYTSGFGLGTAGWEWLFPYSKNRYLSAKQSGRYYPIIDGIHSFRGY